MSKFISVILLFIVIGCKDTSPSHELTHTYTTYPEISEVCLNGVAYYIYTYYNKGGLSVAIDKDTLQPKLCNV